MKNELYIMSTCLSKCQGYSKFKLRGEYLGKKISYIYISNLSFVVGKEYIAEVSNIKLEKDRLLANCTTFKEIIHLR